MARQSPDRKLRARRSRIGGLPMSLAIAVALSGCAATRFGVGAPQIPKPTDGVLVSRAEGLPDFNRGAQALNEGRPQDAQRDLLPLAERGYPDAMLLLAASYAATDTLASEQKALDWYRKVLPQRPEAALGIARVLMASGTRQGGMDALRQIRGAQTSGMELQADNLLLGLFVMHPYLDTAGDAPALAARLAQSPVDVDRRQAAAWYRATIADADHVFRLRRLCEAGRRDVPGCYADLAHFYRYGGEAGKLDALVDEALDSFETLARRPGEGPVIAQSAAQMARAMIDQIEVQDVPAIYDGFAESREGTAGITTTATEASVAVTAPTTVGLLPNAAPSVATPTRADLAERIVRWMLRRNSDYIAFAGGVINDNPYLLPDIDLISVLRPIADAGNAEATLEMGTACASVLRGPIRVADASRYLSAALGYRSTRQQAHYQIARLLQRGYLGENDGRELVDHLLAGVRGGNPRSALQLARVFYGTAGIRVNRVGAYVFARLAEDAGLPVLVNEVTLVRDVSALGPQAGNPATRERSRVRMLDRLALEMTDEERTRAESLYSAEHRLRPVPRQPLPADIFSRKASP